jgi:imidazolonepropionase-like amidohydrolase
MRNFAMISLFATAVGTMFGQNQPVAFLGARIIDGTGASPVTKGVLIVRQGKIEAVGPADKVRVPAGAARMELAGKTIMPGMINAHGHVGETKGLRSGPQFYTEENVLTQLKLYAAYGVTTVWSLGGDTELAMRLRDGQSDLALRRARIYAAGPVVVADTPQAARKMVDQVAAMKADVVKIRVDDNLGTGRKMPKPVYEAVLDQAKHHGLRVAAHIYYLDDAKSLLDGGVGFIAHSVRDKEVDQGAIAMFKKRDVCLCPTLTREVSTFVYESTPDFFQDPFFLRHADPAVLRDLQDPKRQQQVRESKSAQQYKLALEMASRNLKKLVDAGVRIAFGTDTGPPARFQGYFEHLELELMAKAGLTPMQILKSATGDAARCMNLARQVGTLEPGAWADFLVLGDNPLDDIKNTRTLEQVWIAGNRVEIPAAASAPAGI